MNKKNINNLLIKIRQIFEDVEGHLSSKRVFGSIGFISAIIMAFKGIPTDTIIAVLSPSALMIGLDSVTDIWKYRENKGVKESPKIVEHEIAG
jgi:hypothetical protein